MAEGDTVHRNALRLRAALVGRRLTRVEAPDGRIAPQRLERRLVGATVADVDAVGKHMLVRFDDGRVLHSHLGMVGAWRLSPAGAGGAGPGMWLALWTDSHVARQFGGPRLRLHEAGAPIPAIAGLGPDLLDVEVDPATATAAALARCDPGRPVGDALLDQRVVSGIGNVYRAETLFLCGVEPSRPVGDVDAQTAARLGTTAAALMRDGVRHSGPISSRRRADGRPLRERNWVYGRRGRPCLRCGATIRAVGSGDANRAVFWCPDCQT